MKRTKGYYRVKFDDQRKVHALTTHHAPIGDHELDSMFGGGFYVVCREREPEGHATIYEPHKNNDIAVTCKKCLSKIELKTTEQMTIKPDKNDPVIQWAVALQKE